MTTGNFSTRNKGEYQFVCFYWETSRAWGHEVHLLKHGMEFAKARVRYYNRTWEAYTFQSTMYQALDNYKKSEIAHYLNEYKLTHDLKGYDRDNYQEWEKPFPRGVKAKALAEWEQTQVAKDIKELEEFVKEGK